MRKHIYLVLLLALGGMVFGQTATSSVSPKTAKAMGMGGTFRVFSTGYDTFFGNPAGFAAKDGSLTIADLATWAYFKPTQDNIDKAMAIADGTATESETASYVGDWVINNGLGVGAALGLGWAGKGFGLGATLVTDEVASGTSLLSSVMTSRTQATAIAGVAFPVTLGPISIRLGADARAYYLLDSYSSDTSEYNWPFANIVAETMSGSGDPMTAIRDLDIVGGYGFAFDAGATIGFGPLMIGAMIRDYGLEFYRGATKVGTIMDTMTLPTDGTDAYILMPEVSVGAGLQFNLGKVLAPSFYIETEDPLAIVDEGMNGMWNKLHAGAEVKLLNFLALRAGLNKGWVSLGAGVDLLIFEVDAALFTEEMGDVPGDFGRTGIAIQAAIRL
ncbi:MAG TPA: hypothetical protein VN445_11475 [Rectinemataceae bacterium]|nr:hypothetical protein [Rectinemataceae bacterium]